MNRKQIRLHSSWIFILMARVLPCLCVAAVLTANVVRAAEKMTGDELKSQQKSSLVFKSRDGVTPDKCVEDARSVVLAAVIERCL